MAERVFKIAGKVNPPVGEKRLMKAFRTVREVAAEYKSNSAQYATLVETMRLLEMEMRYEGVSRERIDKELHGG